MLLKWLQYRIKGIMMQEIPDDGFKVAILAVIALVFFIVLKSKKN